MAMESLPTKLRSPITNLTEPTPFHSLFSGVIGGVCMVVVGHPLDLVKVRQQTHSNNTSSTHRPRFFKGISSTFTGLKTIVKTEGSLGLYRGLLTPLLAVAPTFAVEYGAFELIQSQFKQKSKNQKDPLNIWEVTMAGGLSAVPATILVTPAERIKCLIQAANPLDSNFSRGQGIISWAWRESGGIRGLYTGSLATLLRDIPGAAAYFGTYHTLKRKLSSSNSTSTSPFVIMIAGGFAGMANWLIAIPADVIKSRQQSIAYSERSLGFIATGYQLIRNEGISGLFRGLTPALIRAFPANAACFIGIETTLRLMGVDSN